MKKFRYQKIDAFTSINSSGNPAACLYLDPEEKLTSKEMLEIGKKHKGFVSEVVFCSPSTSLNYNLTYYSSECEVDFCGHGTIACMYSLIKSDLHLYNEKEIYITTKNSALTVYNKIEQCNAIFITAPAPGFIGTLLTKDPVSEALGVQTSVISKNCPIDLINAGLNTLIVPVVSLSSEISISPDESKLKSFCLSNNIDIILIYSNEVKDTHNFIHSRVFAPKFGYLEDPATGSGNSALGYYLLKNHLWDGSAISIEQGADYNAFNIVKLMAQNIHGNTHVLFGGSATVRIDGTYYL